MILLLLAGTIIQTLLPAYAILGGVKVPVLLAFIIYYSLNKNIHTMFIAAFLAGVLQDSLSLSPLGYSSALFIFTSWVISHYRKLVIIDSFMTPIIFGAISGIIVTFMQALLLAHNGIINISPFWILLRMLGSGFLCALITPIIFMLVKALDRSIGSTDIRESLQ